MNTPFFSKKRISELFIYQYGLQSTISLLKILSADFTNFICLKTFYNNNALLVIFIF